jgi:uncharacterized protein YjdB
VHWTSSNNAIAQVSDTAGSKGVVSGKGVSTATITATDGDVSGTNNVSVTPAALLSISVDPPDSTIAKGTTVQLTATGTFSDSTTQDLTSSVAWDSSDDANAHVSNAAGTQGLVTGTGQGGPATITATSGGISGTATVTVTAATLVSIAITPADQSIAKGTTIQLTATGTFSDTTTQDLTTLVGWTSADNGIAQVSNVVGTQGLVTGIGLGGPVTITATSGGSQGTTTVTVTAPTLDTITIAPVSPSVVEGTTVQLTATAHFHDGSTQDLTALASWSSSANTIAQVSNAVGSQGLVAGTGLGTATITANFAGVTGTTGVTVAAATLNSIVITPANPTLSKGDTVQLTATGHFTDGSTQDLTALVSWASSNHTVAHVVSSGSSKTNGRLKGNKSGTATITATFAGISGMTTATVL